MRRLKTVLCIIGFAAVLGAAAPPTQALAQAQSDGPTLAPAEYKPLPVGTLVNYDTWSYTVTKSNGFDITYKAGYGWAHQYAIFGKAGDGVYEEGEDWSSTLDGKSKQALEGLWPLKVGNKVHLETQEEAHRSRYAASVYWEIIIEVTGTEVLDLNGVRYATYVVREQAATDGAINNIENVRSAAKYAATHWYDPGSGLVLKSSKQWIEGDLQGDEEEYLLTRVRYPKGTTNLALKGTPVGMAAAPTRPDPELTRRQGEIARLKQSAEAPAAAPQSSNGPALAPAQFTPLPMGTRVNYDTWSYTVTKSNGFDITYKVGDDWAHHYAVFGKAGDGVYGDGDWTASLDGAAKTTLESLWPLKVGNKVRLQTREEPTPPYYSKFATWEIVIEVAGTEVLDLNGVRYATYVVREQASRGRSKYVATHWYHPGSGLVLKSIKNWIKGPSQGEEEKYRLTNVSYPEGTTNLALKGTPSERTKREAQKENQAEIARLKIAAEANRKSPPQISETVEQYKAEIDRLRREAEKRQKAELERLKREADIARLRRETEAARQSEVAATRKQGDKRVENALWTVARGSRSIDDTQAYLDRYPKGRYAGEAEARLSVLEKFAAVEGINFGTYHALIIGNNDYRNLPKLKTAVNDAKTVAAVLAEDYGFKVKTLINATHAEIIDTLDEYRETLRDVDNLLIYYAGHGWLDEDTDRGYWLPVDAKKNRRSRWVSNATISDTLKALLAKHVMVVADSCYSGTLARGAGVSLRSAEYWRRMAEKRTRVALTSGGLEPVADKGGGGHSPFAKAFINTLRGNDVVMDATQLFSAMRRPVMLNADQTPEYSDVRNAGHDGGDFLFVKKF